MITNSQCWLRGNPKLCNQSECDKPTCTRLIKLDRLFSNAGISLPQRKQKSLIIRSGRNEIDRNSYKQLNSIKNNIHPTITPYLIHLIYHQSYQYFLKHIA